MKRVIAWLSPTAPTGLHPIHYVVATILLMLALIAENTAVAVITLKVEHRAISGSTAARPGVPLVPGTKPTVPTNVGLGGAVARSSLSSEDGLGADYCSSHYGSPLGAHYRNVYACAPATGTPPLTYDSTGYQCVELSVRFVWDVFHRYILNVPSGAELVNVGHAELGIPIGYPARHVIPLPGDVLSLSGAHADPWGHTAVVVRDGVDANGNGSIGIMEENGSASGLDQINVRGWQESYGDPGYANSLFYYPNVSWLKLVAPGQPPLPRLKHLHLWHAWTHHHHRKPIPYLSKRHLTWQAFAWERNPARYGGVVAKPVRHNPHKRHGTGYWSQNFVRGTIFCFGPGRCTSARHRRIK
jgi:hypothetical protein